MSLEAFDNAQVIHEEGGKGAALFSPDRRHRWILRRYLKDERWWSSDVKMIVNFLMLNPSTADGFADDPTVRRCMAFAEREGGDVLEVTNIFALRSTDPKSLYTASDIGDCAINDGAIICAAQTAGLVVCAWGSHGELKGRGDYVRRLLKEHAPAGTPIRHLGLTKTGEPRHPLYLASDTALQEFPS